MVLHANRSNAMTRVCMDCKAVMGEKCPKCGSNAIVIDGKGFCLRDVANCCHGLSPFHVHGFPVGEGGATHGLCASCFAFRNHQLRQRKTTVGCPA